jgi:DNA invertase Pin-like site-specific DNA recombinase
MTSRTEKGSRAAIYARVSTKDQHPENQVLELRRYAEARGWTVIEEYVDQGISGAKDRRPALDKLMDAARRRKLDIVLVSRFDRFARSVRHLVAALDEFRALGVAFVAENDAIDTTTPTGKLTYHVIAALSEFERSLIQERIMSGLSRARAQGKKLGRPPVAVDADQVRVLRQKGLSLRAIAREMSISKDAAARALSQNGV